VQFLVSPGEWTWTTQNASGDTQDSVDSDVNVSGWVDFIAPPWGLNMSGPGQTDNPTLDAGLVELVSVGDYVWYDTDRDGLQDAGELPAGGVTVRLLDAQGNEVAETQTNGTGYYWFSDLWAGGSYTVEFVKPAGYAFTTEDANGTMDEDAGTDSDADVSTGRVTFTAPDTGDNRIGVIPTDNPTIDAGLVELVSIGDSVWWDRDRNGQQGPVDVEPPVSGVVVNLYDSMGVFLKTTTTNDVGFYSFNDLLAGATYTVEFVLPADSVFTVADAVGDAVDMVDSDADVLTGRVLVTAPVTGGNSLNAPDDSSFDAGLVELVSIGDYVWWDTDRDGIQDEGELPVKKMVVNLLDASGNPAVLPDGAPVTTTTNDVGFYSFTNLIGGVDYIVEFVKPDNTVFTWMDEGADDTVDSDADVDGLVLVTAPVTGVNSATAPDDPSIDAGLVKLVSIGDYVWFDTNRDGLQGPVDVEPPVEGVTVNLYDEWGVLVATAVTGADGFYSFTDLWAGAPYVVEFVKPAGSSFTTVDAGDDTADSDADLVTGQVFITAPADGLNSAVTPDDPSIDAGLVKYNLSLVKTLTSAAVVYPGDTVTFVLTPHNDGPTDALAGWSVTEVVPDGLTLVSMTGTGYVCSGVTCVAEGVLAAGADGNPITVTFTASGTGNARNIAYVDKNPQDVPEDNPLGPNPPSKDTDTTTTPTDNDSEAAVTVTPRLPDTGTDVVPFLVFAFGLMAAGAFLLAATRRHQQQ